METPVGEIWLSEEDGALVAVKLPGEGAPEGEIKETPLLLEAAHQLTDYFEGRRAEFDLPLTPSGTAFQRDVWAALQKIPVGETASYGAVARAVGRPKASRAVGAANHRNPLPILIPCHRVIGANGAMVGYGGGLPLKEALLNLEERFYRERARG
jgi:methylated-DNA-[protein]-cysteine S-methyltransferase